VINRFYPGRWTAIAFRCQTNPYFLKVHIYQEAVINNFPNQYTTFGRNVLIPNVAEPRHRVGLRLLSLFPIFDVKVTIVRVVPGNETTMIATVLQDITNI